MPCPVCSHTCDERLNERQETILRYLEREAMDYKVHCNEEEADVLYRVVQAIRDGAHQEED